jgi:hypothetical protein
MIRAPQSERRCRQDDACARRWSPDTAGQARGRIKLDAFRRGTTIADILREILEPAVPADGAAS